MNLRNASSPYQLARRQTTRREAGVVKNVVNVLSLAIDVALWLVTLPPCAGTCDA